MNYAITITPECDIYEDSVLTRKSDDLFSGWIVSYESAQGNLWKVRTHYGYEGYARPDNFRLLTQEELSDYYASENYAVITGRAIDVLEQPKVQAKGLCTILGNSIVKRIGNNNGGWTRIRTADKTTGYAHTATLRERLNCDLINYNGDFRHQQLPEEKQFRKDVINTAMKYFGTQYRWGGKSTLGIDCSGLAFMSYYENGVIIYRDAAIHSDYPIYEVTIKHLRPADLIYIKGHVAIYMGEGRYIHATANQRNPYVTVNSLNPEDADYREDIAQNIIACGSLYGRQA